MVIREMISIVICAQQKRDKQIKCSSPCPLELLCVTSMCLIIWFTFYIFFFFMFTINTYHYNTFRTVCEVLIMCLCLYMLMMIILLIRVVGKVINDPFGVTSWSSSCLSTLHCCPCDHLYYILRHSSMLVCPSPTPPP